MRKQLACGSTSPRQPYGCPANMKTQRFALFGILSYRFAVHVIARVYLHPALPHYYTSGPS